MFRGAEPTVVQQEELDVGPLESGGDPAELRRTELGVAPEQVKYLEGGRPVFRLQDKSCGIELSTKLSSEKPSPSGPR